MVDKNTFMETLHAVQEIAGTSDKPMDKESALAYFKEMELSHEQEEMVYQFLLLPKEETEASLEDGTDESLEDDMGAEEEAGSNKKMAESEEESSTPHFQMYLDELGEITELGTEAEELLYRKLLSGDTSVIEAITKQWLKRVIALAKEYQGRGSLLDDLVQEGNIGLLIGLNALAQSQAAENKALKEVRQQLEEAVRGAIEEYLGEESGEEQQNETILGKVALIHQAREFLTREKDEAPSLRELSEYTRIPAEEVSDILSLIKGE